MQTLNRRKSVGSLLLLVASLFACLTFTMGASSNSMSVLINSFNYQPALQEMGELETNWRYTRYGWQDSSFWQRTPADVQPRVIDRISPVLFSLDIILAVLGAMIWASDEWQVDRLFGRKPRRADRDSIDNLERKARQRRAIRSRVAKQ